MEDHHFKAVHNLYINKTYPSEVKEIELLPIWEANNIMLSRQLEQIKRELYIII